MKLKQTHETEVYISKSGYITIRQPTDIFSGQEGQAVFLSPEQAEAVIVELTNLLDIREKWWSLEGELDVDN